MHPARRWRRKSSTSLKNIDFTGNLDGAPVAEEKRRQRSKSSMEQIYVVEGQDSNKVTTLLSMDVVGVFDTVGVQKGSFKT